MINWLLRKQFSSFFVIGFSIILAQTAGHFWVGIFAILILCIVEAIAYKLWYNP